MHKRICCHYEGNLESATDMESETTTDLWETIVPILRDQLTESVWFSTFNDAVNIGGTDSILLDGSNHFAIGRIMSRYRSMIDDALAEIGHSECSFDVRVAMVEAPEFRPSDETQTDVGVQQNPSITISTGDDPGGLNPRYAFETFVKGASNQFALAAAQRVAETPARSYNPLFVYGSAGLGKTHLLHAIGHYVLHHYRHYVVRYVSTESFMNEYVDAIRSNSMAGLRRRYREVDVLLIDDVQFLEGKEGLQEEFFHTFNSLHGANKQIVLSSDRMPDAIPTLEERLRGRFKWGLITDIQPPDLETRLAILRNKSERDRVEVPAETLEFIASNITSNIRELEGALIRVTA